MLFTGNVVGVAEVVRRLVQTKSDILFPPYMERKNSWTHMLVKRIFFPMKSQVIRLVSLLKHFFFLGISTVAFILPLLLVVLQSAFYK